MQLPIERRDRVGRRARLATDPGVDSDVAALHALGSDRGVQGVRPVARARCRQLLMAGAARWKRGSVVWSSRKVAKSARVMLARMRSRPR